MPSKRLYRSATQKMVGGVCGGLAEYFDMDVSLVRLLFVALALVTALLPMALFYLIAWIVVPVDHRFTTPTVPPPPPPPPAP